MIETTCALRQEKIFRRKLFDKERAKSKYKLEKTPIVYYSPILKEPI